MLAPSLTEQYRRMSHLVRAQQMEGGTSNLSKFGTARVPTRAFTSESDRIKQASRYIPQILNHAASHMSSEDRGGGGRRVDPAQNLPRYTPMTRPANLVPRGRFAISMDGRPRKAATVSAAAAPPPALAPGSFHHTTFVRGAAGAGAGMFRYHVEPSKHLNRTYHEVLADSGGSPTPSPENANILFLSQQSCRAIMETPVTAHLDMLPDAKIAYLSGESVLIDHVLREQMRRAYVTAEQGGGGGAGPVLALSEFAVSYYRKDESAGPRDSASRWLVRPRVGPLGPMCHIQEMSSPVWYNPEAIAIRLPHDMYQERDFFTVLRTAVLVCATGQVYLSPEGELLFYDANNFAAPPRQENLRMAGISTADVFGEGVREIFRSFFLSGPGSQQILEGQFQIFWVDALTRKSGGRVQPWWIDVHAVLLSPARRSMFVNAAENERVRALRGSGKAAVRLAKSIVRSASDNLDVSGTFAMVKTCIDCLLRPNSSMLIWDAREAAAVPRGAAGGDDSTSTISEEVPEDDGSEGKKKKKSHHHHRDKSSRSSKRRRNAKT